MHANAGVVDLALPDLSAEVFRFTFRLREALAEEEDAEKIQIRVDEMFQKLEAAAAQAEAPLEDLQHAKYVLAAYVDEMVLNSTLPIRPGWANRPLQLKYFDDSAAGEEFYNRLDNLRHAADVRAAALEMYFHALAQGFRGKFTDAQGQEKRKVLAFKLSQEIRAATSWKGEALTLDPESPPDQPRREKPLPLWLLPVLCAGVLLLAFLAYSLLLDRAVSGFLADFGSML